MQYTKIKNINNENNYSPFIESITFHFAESLCWDDDADYVIGINGGIFKSEKSPGEHVKVFIEVPYRRWELRGMSTTEQNALLKNLMREIIECSFSTERIENPSFLADSLTGRTSSFLVSKILRNSDFTDGDIRYPVCEDHVNYGMKFDSPYKVTIYKKR